MSLGNVLFYLFLAVVGGSFAFAILAGIFTTIKELFEGLAGALKKLRIRRQKSYVNNNSILISELKQLNSKYQFNSLEPVYKITRKCKSRTEYNRTSLYDVFCVGVYKDRSQFSSNVKLAQENASLYKNYIHSFDSIVSRLEKDGLGLQYRKTENEILHETCLKPVTSFKVEVSKSYLSPKGKSFVHDRNSYDMSKVLPAIEKRKIENKEKTERQKWIEHERSLVTPQLRYQVMERDNFRCVLCGASQKDGVMLQVDHIKPVSRGGTSVMDNLQTLCERCNQGKSDRYDL